MNPETVVAAVNPPDCPVCGQPATRHCNQPGCLLFECLACDIWGGRQTDWHPRPELPSAKPKRKKRR